MSGSLVRIVASVQTPPVSPSFIPAFFASSTLERTPAAIITISQGIALPSSSITPSVFSLPVISETEAPVMTCMPFSSR